MRNVLIAGLVLFVALPLIAQPPTDPRKIATLEKKVAALETVFNERNTELRQIYHDLQKKLDKAAADDSGAKLQADVRRVLEPVLASARAQAKRPGTAAAAKTRSMLKTGVPKALAKLEIEPLADMRSYLEARFLAVVSEADKVVDALALTDEDFAKRLLNEALDQQIPFYERWNGGLSDSVAGAQPFRKIHKELSDARIELAIAKDPLLEFQIGCEPGFARVPAGGYVTHYTRGFNTQYRSKNRKYPIDSEVWIGLYEVTNEEYLAWIRTLPEGDRQAHLPRDGGGKFLWLLDPEKGEHLPAADKMKHPVVGVNLRSACLYALSLGCRLPTEGEWAAMAASKDLRPYPWGKTYEPERCNDRENGIDDTKPIGSYPNGRGPFGHYDVAGNVAEWVLTYENGKTVDPAAIMDDGNVAIRGGSFKDSKDDVQTGWVWLKRAVFDREITTGFRLAKDPK